MSTGRRGAGERGWRAEAAAAEHAEQGLGAGPVFLTEQQHLPAESSETSLVKSWGRAPSDRGRSSK